MLSDAREAGDKELQLYLLNQTAERFRTTLYRQTLFAEFELKIHTVVEANEALTAEKMTEMYGEINRAFYGAEVNVDPVANIEWGAHPAFLLRLLRLPIRHRHFGGTNAGAPNSARRAKRGRALSELPARRRLDDFD